MTTVAKVLSKRFSDRNLVAGSQLLYGPTLFMFLYFMGFCGGGGGGGDGSAEGEAPTVSTREQQIGGSGGSLEPPGLLS
jgi:hypothetical protein